ncbi:MAG: sensor histidine kinase [Bacilli bacterium]
MLRKQIKQGRNYGLSPYVWAILSILPYYFIFQSSSTVRVIVGISGTILFYLFYRFAFIAKGWSIYLWTLVLIAFATAFTVLFNYVYFAFFIAYFIGTIRPRVTFYVLYGILLGATTISIFINIITQEAWFLQQLPFIIITWICVLLLPLSFRNKSRMEQLEEKLESANQKIAELVVIEERERIARDLHDTLGQKLSLIGLKSDLARKLIAKDPERARTELKDVQQTARTALNEVRQLVSSMRTIRLDEELKIISQLLSAADIELMVSTFPKLKRSNLLIENILSMCLKEAVTNIVKHSGASVCAISLVQTETEIILTIHDNGTFVRKETDGRGLQGMKERLEFVNGSLVISTDRGTTLQVTVPNDVTQRKDESS